MTIAFWDFDETITTSDSLWHFLVYTQSWSKLFKAAVLFSPILLGMALGLISNVEAKIKVLGYFFGNWETNKMDLLSQGFAQEVIPKLLNPKAVEKLAWHKSQGHQLVLVSASLENYLKPWCESMGMDCLATKMKERDSKLVAAYEHKNCYGIEKVNRIKAAYNLADYHNIFAYGNSEKGDGPMLELASEGKAFFRRF